MVRDNAIKRFARPLSGQPVAEQARQVLAAAARYKGGRWRFDQDRETNYNDPQTQTLHRLLTATGGRLPSNRTVRGILSRETNNFTASESLSNSGRGK